MARSGDSAARIIAVVLFGSLAGLQAQSYQEVPGVREFSGRMIARPVSVADWTRRGLSETDAAQRVARAHLAVETFAPEEVAATRELLFSISAHQTENEVARVLLETGLFEYVEPDWIVYPAHQPDDAMFAQQYHHQVGFMRSCDAWTWETGKPEEVVAICDSGIRTTHEDLLLHRVEGYNAVDQLWESAGGAITAVHDHGTQVTGCAAANGNNGRGITGMGWSLGHRMLRVSNLPYGTASMSVLTHAARTAADAGDRAINVSYEGVQSSSVRTTATYVKSVGGLLFWAAGNNDVELSVNDRDADDVIVVGATDEVDGKWSGSNWGRYVDLTAPGSGIWTTDGPADDAYRYVWGTSYASPIVAGLAAMLWCTQPSLTPDQVESILKSTCDDLGTPGVDDFLGYGRINSGRALLETLEVQLAQGGVVTGDLFGWSVDRAGDLVVVGAPGDDGRGPDAGAVYVYRQSGDLLTLEGKLVSTLAQTAENLGWSVATDGTFVFAGAPQGAHAGFPGGKVNVYVKDEGIWQHLQTLRSLDLEAGDRFGQSLDVDATTLVAGAPYESAVGFQAGAAYTFTWDGVLWSEEQKLVASDGAVGDRLGNAVALEGSSLVAGAHAASPGGAVYVFSRGGGTPPWVEQSKHASVDAVAGDSFGFSLAISSDALVVGAPNEDDLGSNSGSVHVYRRIGPSFGHEAELHATDGEAGDYYGYSVAAGAEGGAAVVGALLANENDSGTVYVNRWKVSGWLEELRLFASSGEPLGFYGSSLALSDEQVVVGARSADDPAVNGGTVSLYDLLRLRLTVDPSAAAYGEVVVMHCAGSQAGGPVLTFTVAVDGSPFLFRLFSGRADLSGDWVQISSIPPGLGGTVVQMMCFGQTRDGRNAASNVEVLALE